MAVQAVDLDPCLLLTPGMVLLMSLGQSRPAQGLSMNRMGVVSQGMRQRGRATWYPWPIVAEWAEKSTDRTQSRWNRPPCTTFQHPTSSL